MTNEQAHTTELLPCPNPWCDPSEWPDCQAIVSISQLDDDGNVIGQSKMCAACCVCGPVGATEAEAITAWNTRDPAIQGETDALREAVLPAPPSTGARPMTVDARNARIAKLEEHIAAWQGWFARADDGDNGCDYLNEEGWEDGQRLAAASAIILAQQAKP